MDPPAIANLRRDVLDATRLPGVTRGTWGIVVHSLDRDERLLELNPQSLFVPASVVKLVSVATAVDAVGWDYRFTTTTLATGPVVDGALRGDLMVVGSGDPSIGGRGGTDLDELVAAIAAFGVRQIEGRVIGDDDGLEEPRPQLSWAWDDLGYPTGAIFGGLNVAENRTLATVTPGDADGDPATLGLVSGDTFPFLGNRAVTGAAGTDLLLWPEQRPGEPFLTIAGSIPLDAPPAQVGIAVGNPTLWFARSLRNRLLAAGVTVAGDAVDLDDVDPPIERSLATIIATHVSPSLADIAKPLLKESINLYGEALMRLNVGGGAFPTNDAALEGLARRLAAWGLAEGSYQLVDGSGLSRRNALSPEAVLTVLRHMDDPSGQSPFVTALPIAGVEGSLETRMTGTAAAGRIRAKTGTMSNVRSLAGYATTVSGERLAFVILLNNFEGTGAMATQALDTIAVRLATFTRSRAN